MKRTKSHIISRVLQAILPKARLFLSSTDFMTKSMRVVVYFYQYMEVNILHVYPLTHQLAASSNKEKEVILDAQKVKICTIEICFLMKHAPVKESQLREKKNWENSWMCHKSALVAFQNIIHVNTFKWVQKIYLIPPTLSIIRFSPSIVDSMSCY